MVKTAEEIDARQNVARLFAHEHLHACVDNPGANRDRDKRRFPVLGDELLGQHLEPSLGDRIRAAAHQRILRRAGRDIDDAPLEG